MYSFLPFGVVGDFMTFSRRLSDADELKYVGNRLAKWNFVLNCVAMCKLIRMNRRSSAAEPIHFYSVSKGWPVTVKNHTLTRRWRSSNDMNPYQFRWVEPRAIQFYGFGSGGQWHSWPTQSRGAEVLWDSESLSRFAFSFTRLLGPSLRAPSALWAESTAKNSPNSPISRSSLGSVQFRQLISTSDIDMCIY